MKGQHHSLSAFLPRDLMSFLSIKEEDFDFDFGFEETQNKQKKQSSPRRCFSHEVLGFDSLNLFKLSQTGFSQENTSFSSKQSSSIPSPQEEGLQKAPIVQPLSPLEKTENPLIQPNVTFKEFFSDKCNQQNFLGLIQSCSGSHFLQKMISTVDSSDIDLIYSLLAEYIKQIMCDNYGNYFLQKIIAKSTKTQRLFLLNLIRNDFEYIINDISGTHCIQVLVECMSSKEEEKLIKSYVKDNLFELATSQNSTHVIQKLVIGSSKVKRNYLTKFIIKNFLQLSLNLNGATVIKKFLAEIKSVQLMKLVLSILEKYYLQIVENQFGNYIIQEAFDYFGYSNCQSLIMKIVNNGVYFSLQKYSSNVIDKIAVILRKNNPYTFGQFIEMLLLVPQNVNSLIQNKYGMFVLGNVAKLLTTQEKNSLKKIFINRGQEIFHMNINNSKLSKFLCLFN